MDTFKAITDETFVERFWSKVDKQSEGCWEWTSTKKIQGFGVISYKQRCLYAHRLAYLLHYKTLDQSLPIRHKCHNKSCCNPEHLFMETQRDNTKDCINKGRVAFQNKWNIGIINRNITHCKQGHAFDETNTGKTAKGRYCKRCQAVRYQAVRRKRR